MEQKMLLPIVLIVVVGGFVIGYYAATFGGAGKTTAKTAAGSLPAWAGAGAISKAQYPEFFQAQTFTQFLTGQLVSTTGDSVVISKAGRNLAVPKARVTNYFISTATGRTTVDAKLLKAGEPVTIALTLDPETGNAISLAVTGSR